MSASPGWSCTVRGYPLRPYTSLVVVPTLEIMCLALHMPRWSIKWFALPSALSRSTRSTAPVLVGVHCRASNRPVLRQISVSVVQVWSSYLFPRAASIAISTSRKSSPSLEACLSDQPLSVPRGGDRYTGRGGRKFCDVPRNVCTVTLATMKVCCSPIHSQLHNVLGTSVVPVLNVAFIRFARPSCTGRSPQKNKGRGSAAERAGGGRGRRETGRSTLLGALKILSRCGNGLGQC